MSDVRIKNKIGLKTNHPTWKYTDFYRRIFRCSGLSNPIKFCGIYISEIMGFASYDRIKSGGTWMKVISPSRIKLIKHIVDFKDFRSFINGLLHNAVRRGFSSPSNRCLQWAKDGEWCTSSLNLCPEEESPLGWGASVSKLAIITCYLVFGNCNENILRYGIVNCYLWSSVPISWI